MSKFGYYPNYFSVDDITVTQEKIPCIVESNLPAMGHLDPSNDKAHLEAGRKIELPLWYAQQFTTNRSRLFKVEIPEIYKKMSKEICEADANAVNLKRLNQYFYEFGRYLIGFDRMNTVGPILHETCRQRCRHLMDLCKGENCSEIKCDNKMDNSEMKLFVAGTRQNEKFSKWLLNETATIETSAMVVNHKKRKFAALEVS